MYYGKIMSCAELSLHIDKSIPLITKALNHLIDMGFVTEQGYAPSSGGRRPLMYALKADRLYMITVAMDQLSTRIVTVDVVNNYVTPVDVLELKLLNNPDSLQSLTTLIADHIESNELDKEKIIGIGIGMPGFVSIKEGVNHTYLPAGDKSLTQYITDEIGLPVFIDNDSSLIALSELKFGAARAINEATMVINLGWGIGLGMIIDGKLFRGATGYAGELSHIPIIEDGKICSCGKQGCLEAEASLLAVAEKALEGIKNGRRSSFQHFVAESKLEAADALMDAAVMGDQFAVEVLSEAAYQIGRALSILIHIMNPKAIVISGRGVKIGKIMAAPIQQALNKYCIPRLANEMDLIISEIGFDAELIGAAILVMENFNDYKEETVDSASTF